MADADPLYVGACLFFDFLPRQGPPWFRYAGSDPSVPVFNLGWPLVTAIYHPGPGFFLGPLAWPVFATQAVLYAVATALVAWRQRTGSHRPGSDPA